MKRTIFHLLAIIGTFTVTAQDASKPTDNAGLFERLAYVKAAAEDRAMLVTYGVAKPADKLKFFEHYNQVRRDCDMAIAGLIGGLRTKGMKCKDVKALDNEIRSDKPNTSDAVGAAILRAEATLKAFSEQPWEAGTEPTSITALAITDIPDLIQPIIDIYKWAAEQKKARIDALIIYLEGLRLKSHAELLPKTD